ncbi:hypothetical protein [Helicobacter pylori]|uniref:hypothetical protein n=1 Tax=Helicobacter pylori TaxID=210 RepID=UPI000EAFC767|nr:hypothetical protein [Helicobacter pylori]
MKKIEWNEEQRKAFQDLLREFTALIDTKAQEEKQTGKIPKIPKYGSCQNGLNKFLVPWGYACKISPGHGNLSHKPSIAFCRQDILGEGFVNGEKPTPTKGFYLWFAYYWSNDTDLVQAIKITPPPNRKSVRDFPQIGISPKVSFDTQLMKIKKQAGFD